LDLGRAPLNRQLGKRFGDQAYAMEELIAELEAAFLCADLRIADVPRADRACLAPWLAVLKGQQEGDLHRRIQGV
jgi:antirestriction protein ArdC